MIQGGWEFVSASYIITWVVLGVYAASLWVRFRNVQRREKDLSS